MSFRILIIGHRLPNISPAEFKSRYESHISHILEMTGSHFPLSHTRRYIQRADGENAVVFAGSQADFDYDVLAEMVFENEEGFRNFHEILRKKENAEWIEEDENAFFDRKRVRVAVLGEAEVTKRKT